MTQNVNLDESILESYGGLKENSLSDIMRLDEYDVNKVT